MSKAQLVRTIALLVTVAAAVAACSQSDTRATVPTAQPLDARVTDLLPIGPHELTLTHTQASSAGSLSITATGYIELSESYDATQDCSFEIEVQYDFVDKFDNTNSSTTRYEFTKAPGSGGWHRVVQSTNLLYTTGQDIEIGTWVDSADPAAPDVLLPHPLLMTDSGNTAIWCALRNADQVARLADPATGLLEWDAAGVVAMQNAGMEAWVEDLADAVGVSGSARSEFVRKWRTLTETTTPLAIGDAQHRLVRDANGYRWDVSWAYAGVETADGSQFTMVFAPTEPRRIADVDAMTYFERVATSEELRAEILAE